MTQSTASFVSLRPCLSLSYVAPSVISLSLGTHNRSLKDVDLMPGLGALTAANESYPSCTTNAAAQQLLRGYGVWGASVEDEQVTRKQSMGVPLLIRPPRLGKSQLFTGKSKM